MPFSVSQVDGAGYKWGFSTALKYAFTCSAKILFTWMVCINGGSSKNRVVSIGTSLVDPIPLLWLLLIITASVSVLSILLRIIVILRMRSRHIFHSFYFLFPLLNCDFGLVLFSVFKCHASTTASSDLQPVKIAIVLFQFSKSDAVLDNNMICFVYYI